MKNHIVIMGFNGSGKTRVGKRLAKDLNLPYLDVDKSIVSHMKMSVTHNTFIYVDVYKRQAEVFKGFVKELAVEKGRQKDYNLYAMVERLAPKIIAEERRIYKGAVSYTHLDVYKRQEGRCGHEEGAGYGQGHEDCPGDVRQGVRVYAFGFV